MTTPQQDLNWEALRAKAIEVAGSAYCPYSGLQVGAAALVVGHDGASDGDVRMITGCNVENASYGLAVCAEVVLAGQLRLTGGGRLVALACRSGTGELLMPCGRCRQVIYEFGGPDLIVDTPDGPHDMTWVLPAAFGPEHLPRGE
ncbi:MAG: cytidine deaminase [Actinomycetota bacterium]|nr:cytidine deaminase [Actinomycetota bacterium]